MNLENFFQSKSFKLIIFCTTCVLISIFIFSLGVFVGIKKASFSFQWADEYHRNFGGPQGGLFGEFMGTNRGVANANGSFGKIIKIEDNKLTVMDRDAEKIILVDKNTDIVYLKNELSPSSLKINDSIIVIGDPNASGQIIAKLIRVMPPRPELIQGGMPVDIEPQY